MWSLKNRWKIRDIRSVFVLWTAIVIIAGKVLMTFCKLWLVLVIQSLYMHCPSSTPQCASQSFFSSNFTKTISPNQFQFVFFQASLPLVEPVAVVEAAIDDLIEDRVALERLEEVPNMCFFFNFWIKNRNLGCYVCQYALIANTPFIQYAFSTKKTSFRCTWPSLWRVKS